MNLPIEKQVCSLEYAQKLKELGLKQESLFCWCKYHTGKIELVDRKKWDESTGNRMGLFSAFTSAELGEMLPERVLTNKGHTKWSCRWWTGDVMRTDKATNGYVVEADTEADARAKMVCYLLENHLIRLD